MKKTVIFMLVVVSLVLVGCAKEVAEEQPEAVEPEPEPEPVPVEEAVEPEPEPEPEAEQKTVSDLKCVDGKIEGVIINVLEEPVTAYDIRVILNGMVVNPALLGCGSLDLQPGESTKCESLNGRYPTKPTNTLLVAVGMAQVKEILTC